MADDLVIGGQLGSYLIESVIARGGMSVVYRAKHVRLGTLAALKVLAPALSSDDTFRERFLREAEMAAGVHHPNVIPTYDVGLHGDSLYIVMRYVSGGDLKTLLAASGPLDPQQAISLLKPVADALDAAHAEALVHRDVKPGNILIERSAAGEIEHVYLTDFGVAKSTASVRGLTRAGGLIGTVEYMAPEQSYGGHVSAATDEYALAAVFYECITGHAPFERELAAGAWPPGEGALEPPSSTRPELPAGLDGVLAKALARDPSERYATCEQLLSACSRVMASSRVPTSRRMSPRRRLSLRRRHPRPRRASAERGDASRAPSGAAPSATHSPGRPSARAGLARGLGYAATAVAAAVVAAAVAVLLSSSSSTRKLAATALAEVPTNNVTGSGTATVQLSGNVASVTVTTDGLDYNDAVEHLMHIHAGGKGLCPPASAARLHNGHLSISFLDGISFYGPVVESLTTRGDTSTSSILAFPRYPVGGNIRYTRTITLAAHVAALIRENNAVVVVHGTDYEHAGAYEEMLGRSELNSGRARDGHGAGAMRHAGGARRDSLGEPSHARARARVHRVAGRGSRRRVHL